MKITKHFLMENRTAKGGWTRAQIEALGIQYPPKHGWHEEIIGKEFSQAEVDAFLAARMIYTKPHRNFLARQMSLPL